MNFMPYNPQIHHRRSIRLKGYDYSQEGLYFITICVQHRLHLFGNIVGATLVVAQNTNQDESNPDLIHPDLLIPGSSNPDSSGDESGRPQGGRPQGSPLRLNDAGMMVENEWLKLADRFPNVRLHDFQVMPNHFHSILEITEKKDKTVGNIVGAFQSIVSVEYIHWVKEKDWEPFPGKLWQRDYWEHIFRNQREYDYISGYIRNNPFTWDHDVLK